MSSPKKRRRAEANAPASGALLSLLLGIASCATLGEAPSPPGDAVEATRNANRVILYEPATLRREGNGYILGWFRTELQEPRDVDGVTVSSVRKQLEVDCIALRYRELTVQGYAGRTLRYPVAGLKLSANWTLPLAESSDAGQALRQACRRAPVRTRTSRGDLPSDDSAGRLR